MIARTTTAPTRASSAPFYPHPTSTSSRTGDKLPRPIPSLLGEPEAKTKSGLSEDWDQWVYASRGLTAHVRRNSHEVVTLFAYKPTSVAEFLQSDIAKVSKNEAPIEDLK